MSARKKIEVDLLAQSKLESQKNDAAAVHGAFFSSVSRRYFDNFDYDRMG